MKSSESYMNGVRLEHVAINVKEPIQMAQWYCENLGMTIKRHGEPPISMHFLAAAGDSTMIEIYCNPPDAVPDYAAMDPLLFHIAFTANDIKAIQDALIAAGATLESHQVAPNGDELLMLRDPWGVALQFVKRA
jgi:glyoxylase I family protein